MRQLIITESGPCVQAHGESWGTFPGSTLDVQLGWLAFRDRIDIHSINYAPQPGYNDWTKDEVVRAQASGFDALMRDNAALAAKVKDLERKLEAATETWFDPDTSIIWEVPTAWAYAQACKIVNGRQMSAEKRADLAEKEVAGFRKDVKFAEDQFEKQYDIAQAQKALLNAIELILEGTDVQQGPHPSGPLADLARHVVRDREEAHKRIKRFQGAVLGL